MNGDFEREVEQLRQGNVPGRSGRLRDLFDYFADRGPDAQSASQSEIAAAVFGQTHADADDATVRVYVHRLRKKLEEHYSANPPLAGENLVEIPAGVYALQLIKGSSSAGENAPVTRRNWKLHPALLAMLILAPLLLTFFLGMFASDHAEAPNAIWRPLIASERPVLMVLGDYYIYGEFDPVRPEQSRLIRDFRVDSPQDLQALQEAEPDRYDRGEDVGLNYLPFSTAYGMLELVPMLEAQGKSVSIIAASQVEPDMLNFFDVVYVGLIGGLGTLEDETFQNAGFAIGENYDELIDQETGRKYTSEEARRLAAPVFYRDYALLSRFTATAGAQVVIVAGQRETALRGISPIAAGEELPVLLGRAAQSDSFEAIFEVTGQQGADLNEKLLIARQRK